MFFKKAVLSVGVAALLVPLTFSSGTGLPEYTLSCSPCANPEIDVEKYISIDHGVTWINADGPTEALEVPLGEVRVLKYKVVVTNTGDVELSNITVSDPLYDGREEFIYALNQEMIDPLPPGASFEVSFGWSFPHINPQEGGPYTNTATATGDYGGVTYSDTDSAVYYGN